MAISFSPTNYLGINPIIPLPGPAPTSTPSITSSFNASPGSSIDTTGSAMSSFIAQLQSTPQGQQALQAYAEDPRFTQMIAALMERANQSDAQINSQADDAYNAQRKVTEAEAQKQTTRSLAANGVLPTGGLASQYYNEISTPLFDRINAQRAQTVLDLRNARDNVKQGVTSTLAGLDNNKNQYTLSQIQAQRQAELQRQQLLAQAQYQQASLAQQGQLASQQLAADQARAAQQASLAQAQLDYQKQSDAQRLAFSKEQAALENQRFYAGGGGGNGGGVGGGGNSFGFDLGANDTAKMQQNYKNMWSGTPESNWGKSTFNPNAQQQYPTASQSTQSSIGKGGSALNSAASGVSWSGNTYAGSAPTASFYNPPASGSNFSSPTSMFYYS